MEKKQVSFDEARQFFIAFLDTLSYCHSNGIIHRDIKPENIMLKSEILNNFVLIDFGLSFNLEEQEKITLTNQQLGNRFLLLPELVSGTPEQKQLIESDCAQACGVFFYLLTGVIPNSLLDGEGKAPHRREVSIKRLADKIDNEVVLRNINSLFDKAFANNLEERYHTANDIRKDLMTLFEYKVTALGDKNMGTGLIVSNNNDTFSYSVLMKTLNPETEIVSPSGLQLPMVTNVNELMNYCIALPHPVVEKVMKYYNQGDFATAASQIWLRTISLLRKRVLSLGEEFVADMVESDDIGYVRDLPAYKVIDLAHELGFIDKGGSLKLLRANELFNYFNNDEADEYEEMPQDESNIIIKTCIRYVLYNSVDSYGLKFDDFRDKLKSGRITYLFEDDKAMFAMCPYYYLKTTVRSLLKIFSESDGIEYDNIVANMNIIFPSIWERLKIEERRALADAYTDYGDRNDHVRAKVLRDIMLKVRGFDYVKENIRSRTYISVANKLIDAHFSVNNFYTEPGLIQKLENLGTAIPKLALKECITAVLFVKLGNGYGVSWNAAEIADRILDKLGAGDWETYIDKYMFEERLLVDSICENRNIRKNWKTLVEKFKLNELNIITEKGKRIVSLI